MTVTTYPSELSGDDGVGGPKSGTGVGVNVTFKVNDYKSSAVKDINNSIRQLNSIFDEGFTLNRNEIAFHSGYAAIAGKDDFLNAAEDAILNKSDVYNIFLQFKTGMEIILGTAQITAKGMTVMLGNIRPQFSITLDDGSIVVVDTSLTMVNGKIHLSVDKIDKAYDPSGVLIPTTVQGLNNYHGTYSDIGTFQNYLNTISPNILINNSYGTCRTQRFTCTVNESGMTQCTAEADQSLCN